MHTRRHLANLAPTVNAQINQARRAEEERKRRVQEREVLQQQDNDGDGIERREEQRPKNVRANEENDRPAGRGKIQRTEEGNGHNTNQGNRMRATDIIMHHNQDQAEALEGVAIDNAPPCI